MRFLRRHLYGNINLLNILLFLIIIALAIFFVFPQFFVKFKFVLPAGNPKIGLQQEIPAGDIQAPLLHDYAVIGENNLFHPERKIIKEVKPLPKPELILYGTIIGDGISTAFIEDKKSSKTTPGRGKRQTAVKKGDILSGFVLKEIKTDRIILSRGEEIMVVNLAETGKQRESETALSFPKTNTPTSVIPLQRDPTTTPGSAKSSFNTSAPVVTSAPSAIAPIQAEHPTDGTVYAPRTRSIARQQKYLSQP
jgi:hypothetical protein